MSNPDKRTSEPDIESMFVLSSGRFSRGLERIRLARGARLRTGRVALLMAVVTWLPLLALACVEGVALGERVEVPFLMDFLPYGQFLLAVPVLVFGEVIVGKLLGGAAAELRRSDVLVAEDTPALETLLACAVERWRGRGVNTVLVLLSCGGTVVWFLGAREWLTGGWQSIGERTTLAGWWYLLISMPVMRFLVLRWLWRLLLWAWVLWRTAALRIQPRPTHPDRAGGLAFLGSTQAVFGLLVFTFSVQFSCLMADAVCYRGAELMSFKGHVLAFVLIAVVALLLPLVVFAPKLMRARAEDLLFLSGTGYHGADHLEQKLRAERVGELPANEISGLTDFGALYENARLMKPVPLEWRHILVLMLSAVIPFLPLVFLVMPAQEVFRTLGKLLV